MGDKAGECAVREGLIIELATNVHGILVGVTEILRCCEILSENKKFNMVSSLREETGSVIEQFPHAKKMISPVILSLMVTLMPPIDANCLLSKLLCGLRYSGNKNRINCPGATRNIK